MLIDRFPLLKMDIRILIRSTRRRVIRVHGFLSKGSQFFMIDQLRQFLII